MTGSNHIYTDNNLNDKLDKIEMESKLFDDYSTLNNETIYEDYTEEGTIRLLNEKEHKDRKHRNHISGSEGKDKSSHYKSSRRYSYGDSDECEELPSKNKHTTKNPLLRRLSDYFGKAAVVNDKKMCIRYINTVEQQGHMDNFCIKSPIKSNQLDSTEKKMFENYWLRDKQLGESDFETSDDEI